MSGLEKIDVSQILLLLFASLAVVFIGMWAVQLKRLRSARLPWHWPRPWEYVVGLVTDFFDTLGIGSFAPSTAIFRMTHWVPDELIPGTLNVGHTLATIAQALIFISAITVAPMTLLPMIAAAGLGAALGTRIVGHLPRLQIRWAMGFALLLAALLMSLSLWGLMPAGRDELELSGWKWWAGVSGNFVLGMLMPVGIGLYAPCMIMVSLLGLNPLAAFPIMMGSCAFLMPISSLGFFRNGRYLPSAALGLAFGGVIGVMLAAWLVKSMPLDYLRWVVLLVVTVTAVSLLRAAWQEQTQR